MSPALLLLAGAMLGVAIFLAGMRMGNLLSRSHLVSGRAMVSQARAVAAMANEAASRASKDAALSERMTTFSVRLELLLNRLLLMEETSNKTLSILKLEYLGERTPSRRPPPREEQEMPRSPMPRINLGDGWGNPTPQGSEPPEIDTGLAQPVRPM